MPVNDAPVAADDIVSIAQDAPATAINVLGNDTDPETDPLTVSAVTQPASGAVTLAGGTVRFQPASGVTGTTSFTYTVSDGTDTDTATVTVTVDNVNDLPNAVDDSFSMAEDSSAVGLAVLSNDSDLDAADTLSVTASTPAANGSVTCTATECSYTPAADFHGSDSFTYTMGDGNGGSATATVTLTVTSVNDAPVAVDDAVSISQDASATAIDVLGNDTDVDNDPLTAIAVSEVTEPTSGTVTLDSGTVQFQPAVGFTGVATFTYTVSDGTDTATATVTVTVDNVNDGPVAVDDSFSVAEDSGATVLAVLANDSDLDAADTLSVTASTPAANGSVTCTATECSYTPNAHFHGNDSFVYTVSDTQGSVDTATVTLMVTPVNDAPVAVDDAVSIAQDASATAIDVLANDTDVDHDPLTVTAVSEVTEPTSGTVTLDSGTVRFKPETGFTGTATFTYTASDGTDTAAATVTVTVDNVNDVPVATDDSFSVAEDSGATVLAVLANDSDLDAGDTLSVTANTPAANGNVTCTATECSYTPNADFHGSDSFTYTVSDGNGGSATATVTLTVTPVNDAPVAVDDAVSIAQDAPATVIDVLGNDTDADNDPLTAIAVSEVTEPTSGTVTLDSGTVRFQPATGFIGTATFTYTVSDGTDTATAVITITVNSVNTAPQAVADEYVVFDDEILEVPAPGVLANDTDLDDDSLTAELVITTASGELTFAPDGSFTYEPDVGFVGSDDFVYRVKDAETSSEPVHVSIHVIPTGNFLFFDGFEQLP